MNKHFSIDFSLGGFTAILALILMISQPALGQRKDAEKLFTEIRKNLKDPVNEIEIHSIAECTGLDGTYKTEVKSAGVNLFFSQVFSYKEEAIKLRITGDKGTDASGKPLSDFMIFYGRMHDYIRIALQPEYLIRRIDSVITNSEGSKVTGETHSDYRIEYVITNQNLPSHFTFYLDESRSITTWFEEWMFTAKGVKVPRTVRIVDEERIFTFNYTDISIKEIGGN